jgi:hypothetical protein
MKNPVKIKICEPLVVDIGSVDVPFPEGTIVAEVTASGTPPLTGIISYVECEASVWPICSPVGEAGPRCGVCEACHEEIRNAEASAREWMAQPGDKVSVEGIGLVPDGEYVVDKAIR